jgi:hypothetical protein
VTSQGSPVNLPDGRRLLPALLAFERSPGRYPVALREPRPLFVHIGSVMRLAAGRPVEGLPTAASANLELRRAARFFVRTVMLRPGTDPYTLLGLTPDFEPVQLREHYRLMIRLTHPDFEAAGERWPIDAATRINLANDLLSSPQKRADHAMACATTRPRPMLPNLSPQDAGPTPRGAGRYSMIRQWLSRRRTSF